MRENELVGVSAPRATLVVALLFAAGLSLRLALALKGGIWADEGLVLNILKIGSVGEMIDFLRFHESHPPLFYLLLRGWQWAGATSERSLLIINVVIGSLIVPAAYLTARRLFSTRAGILAACLVAFSPSLSEHSAQLRPYGLLPILVLGASFFLIEGLDRGRARNWICYAVSVGLFLYTHTWTWLVFGGHVACAALLIATRKELRERRRMAGLAGAVVLIGILYTPWLSPLVYQVIHAGHTAPPIDNLLDRAAYILFGFITLPYLMLSGTWPLEKLGIVVASSAATIVMLLVYVAAPHRVKKLPARVARTNTASPATAAIWILVGAPVVTLVAAFVMSPRSNLILDRCIAMLAPGVLIAAAYGIVRLAERGEGLDKSKALAFATATFALSFSIASNVMLLRTTRSNAREAAQSVLSGIATGDLVVVAPEWYAPSFNHYFPPVARQIDYPHPGRSGLLDFADVRTRALDTTATVRLRAAIEAQRQAGQRVWLVTARNYLRYVDDVLPTMSAEEQRSRYTSVMRVKEARDALVEAYGPPDTSYFVKGPVSRYEEIIPLLFEPDRAQQ